MPTAVNLSLDWIVTRSKKPTLLRGRSQRREAADVLHRTLDGKVVDWLEHVSDAQYRA
jgi:hypothetical protein